MPFLFTAGFVRLVLLSEVTDPLGEDVSDEVNWVEDQRHVPQEVRRWNFLSANFHFSHLGSILMELQP